MNSELYFQGERFIENREYVQCLNYLNNLDSTERKSPLVSYYEGTAKYYLPDKKENSIQHFEAYVNQTDSLTIMNNGHQHVFYQMAKLYHLNYQFDEAIKFYQKYMRALKTVVYLSESEIRQIKEDTKSEIRSCQYGMIAVKNPRNVIIEGLGDSINSKYPDYAPVVSQNESTLFFTSRRADTRGGKIDENGFYYEDIYSADLLKGSLFNRKEVIADTTTGEYFNLVTDFEYANLSQLGEKINTRSHEGCIQLDSEDKVLYFYRDNDIWSIKLDDSLAEAEKLGVHVNSSHYEPSIFFSYDKQSLFVVSDKEGGYGGLDIYISKKDENGDWTDPVNLGPNINTAEDEDAPYLDPDAHTFYFSSKGHSSMGGYDIFRVEMQDSTVSVPVNLGFPVNTPADDIYFTMTARYNRGYYSSRKFGGKGDMDIYRITFTDERDPVAELKGLVKKGDKLLPAQSKITVVSEDRAEEIVSNTDTLKGDYFVLLGHGKRYNMYVETEEFAPYQRTIDIPEQKNYFQLYQEIHHIHLTNGDGEIIGQKITVFNASGTSESDSMYYSNETQSALEKIKKLNDIEGDVQALSDVKFYITKDSLRKLMEEDTTIDFNFDSNVQISFLNSPDADVTDSSSFSIYHGDLKRDSFLQSEDQKTTIENAISAEQVEGLFYTVQIGVYSRDIDHSVLYNLDPIVTLKTKNNLFRYSTGTFYSFEKADVRKKEIVDIGIKDAFVTAYYKGERITLEKARNLIQKYGQGVLMER